MLSFFTSASAAFINFNIKIIIFPFLVCKCLLYNYLKVDSAAILNMLFWKVWGISAIKSATETLQ